MQHFEPFLRENTDELNFSNNLERAKVVAISDPFNTQYSTFDTYGLTPLGFCVSEELARLVSKSTHRYKSLSPQANVYVPRWVKRGNEALQGDFPVDFHGTVYDALTETITEDDINAIDIAINCMHNGSAAVLDANLIARSVLATLGFVEDMVVSKVETLRRSSKLVSRLAMLNDMLTDGTAGRKVFSEFMQVVNPGTGILTPQYLIYDEVSDSVDLSDEAKAVLKSCSIPGGGCPALRSIVQYKGQRLPMILAFWDSCVDVIAKKVEGLDTTEN